MRTKTQETTGRAKAEAGTPGGWTGTPGEFPGYSLGETLRMLGAICRVQDEVGDPTTTEREAAEALVVANGEHERAVAAVKAARQTTEGATA